MSSVSRVGRVTEALEPRVARNLPRRSRSQSTNILQSLPIFKICVLWKILSSGGTGSILLSAAGLYFIFQFYFHKMSYDDIDNAYLEQPEKSKAAHFVWQYFAVTNLNGTDGRKGSGCTKNTVCMFCDKSFSGCSTSRADRFFFNENCISFIIADSSSFACMKEEIMKHAKKNLLQSYKAPSIKRLSGDLLYQAYESTEQ